MIFPLMPEVSLNDSKLVVLAYILHSTAFLNIPSILKNIRIVKNQKTRVSIEILW